MTAEEQVVADIRAEIAKLSEDDQLNVKCIAMTLQNVLKAGGTNAQLALALIGAQMAWTDARLSRHFLRRSRRLHAPLQEVRAEWDGSPCCKKCGNEMEWADCWQIDCEQGWYDLSEEDCINYAPGTYARCETCEGESGWWYCSSCEKQSKD